MKCKICGSTINPGDVVCKGCGIPVEQLKKDNNIEMLAPQPGAVPNPVPAPGVQPVNQTPDLVPLPEIKPPTAAVPPVNMTPPVANPMDNSFVADEPVKNKKGISPILVSLLTIVVVLGALAGAYYLGALNFLKETKECPKCEVCPTDNNDNNDNNNNQDDNNNKPIAKETTLECKLDNNDNNTRTTGTLKGTFSNDILKTVEESYMQDFASQDSFNTNLATAESKVKELIAIEGITGTVTPGRLLLNVKIEYSISSMKPAGLETVFGTNSNEMKETAFKAFAEKKGYTCE